MSGRVHVGTSRALVLTTLAVSIALALGCSGKSDSNGDEEDGDEAGAGGTTSTGGASFGGTTSLGGTTSTGGSGGTGGPVDPVCLSVCQRVQMCPDVAPVDCAADCRNLEADAAAAGCTTIYDDFMTCWASLTNVCTLAGSGCEDVANDFLECQSGVTGGCMTGSLPANPSCSALCPRYDACPDASPTCTADCAESDAQAAATGCSVEYDALMGCASTCADICALNDYDCVTQVNDYFSCVITYCAANPSAAPCL